ncbi:hypothetical protein MSG28_015454 [Choristoneura fumiferana]|uniref:Uncharacterized protein n=1 Tax=Choristoneura fumiferana TaxID=7141 RepID=A0ACC0KAB0_CHOFU|nr:hypothetical protein MSG28_015454 [Choristoneura fumiferana]
MIIENPEAFKSWLTSILEPLCDADPAALAKYVYALVKKDKPLEELRDGMLDQLDVFLQQETKPFVDMLFKALETNEYLKLMEKMPSLAPEKEPENEGEAENHGNDRTYTSFSAFPLAPPASNGASPPCRRAARALPARGAGARPSPSPAPAPRHRVVVCRTAKVPPPPPPPPLREHTLVKVLPLTELLEEPVDQPPRRRDRRENMREERRRRRSRSWERRARARRHTRDGERDPDMRRRPLSRSPSPRGRFRNRSPPPAVPDRPNSRSRLLTYAL